MTLLPDERTETGVGIPGLTYIPDYVSPSDENTLLSWIDGQSWLSDLKRRVQHYGYRYDYRARAVSRDSYLGPLPERLMTLGRKLHADGIFPAAPDQVIVNEYLPGQGISAHIDCVPCFAGTIASLSLGSFCIMEFSRAREKKALPLEGRSLVVLSGAARYEWQHAIPARKVDVYGGMKRERKRRVSLTFRNVILEDSALR